MPIGHPIGGAPPPDTGSNVPTTSRSLPDNVVKLFVFILAALFLVGLSKVLPTAAALLAIAITIGVLFKNDAQFVAIVQRVQQAFGQEESRPGLPPEE